MNTALEMATDSEGVLRSELIRRALRYYIQKNPDGVEVFDENSNLSRSRETWSAAHWPNATNGPVEDI